MTYEHEGGSPASPDVDDRVPEVCEKCDRGCSEPCEAFKRLVDLRALREGIKESHDLAPLEAKIALKVVLIGLNNILRAEV